MNLTFCKIKRKLPSKEQLNVSVALRDEWNRLSLAEQVKDKTIAVGVGSRGISQIAHIAQEVVHLISESGGKPFIVPAMGSHGGATAPGQIEVLSGLGIHADEIGCPIHATMETVQLGTTSHGHPVYFDRNAIEADGLIIINRVKEHTDFHGEHESGLLKMLAIGLGKERGASFIHSYGTWGLKNIMPEVGQFILQNANLVAGIAVVEDAYHAIVELEVARPDAVIQTEQRLLNVARQYMPRLPVDDIDVLIVDRLGKDISGTGMDTNIIGRYRIAGEPEPASPNVKSIVVLDVTDASHGNALGVGLADFTVKRLIQKIDFDQMSKNALVSGFLERAKIPLVFDTDESAIMAAIAHTTKNDPEKYDQARIVRIQDTLSLDEMWVSANLLAEVKSSKDFVGAETPNGSGFKNGNLF